MCRSPCHRAISNQQSSKAIGNQQSEIRNYAAAPWHFLYFLPLPHGHGSLRPTFGSSRRTVLMTSSPPVRAGTGARPPGPLGMGSAVADIAADERAAAKAGTASAAGLFIVIGVG